MCDCDCDCEKRKEDRWTEIRTAALREAADFLADERERFADFSFLGKLNAGFRNGLQYGADEIRRMAAEGEATP